MRRSVQYNLRELYRCSEEFDDRFANCALVPDGRARGSQGVRRSFSTGAEVGSMTPPQVGCVDDFHWLGSTTDRTQASMSAEAKNS
jgi:hypothetical protein